MNHPEITTNDIPTILERNWKAGNRKPPLLLGVYGVGKSHAHQKFADDNGFHYIDYRAAYKTFNDVRGFGVPDRETELMKFFRDEDLDFADDKPNYLHLEEVLNASQQVFKVLMQCTLDRRIGKLVFPKDTMIAASSNRLSDRTGVERMLAALADRFAIYKIRPDLDSFMFFMEQHGSSPEVYAFLSSNPSAPYDFKIKEWDGESNLPTFRSFERLDELVTSYGDPKEAANDPLLRAHAASCVGGKYGEMFAQFIKLTSKVGDVDRMIEDADRCALPKEADLRWLIACRAIVLTNADNLKQVLTLAHRLTDPDMKSPDTLQAMESFVGNSVRRRKKDLLRSTAMVEWQIKHADELTSV